MRDGDRPPKSDPHRDAQPESITSLFKVQVPCLQNWADTRIHLVICVPCHRVSDA